LLLSICYYCGDSFGHPFNLIIYLKNKAHHTLSFCFIEDYGGLLSQIHRMMKYKSLLLGGCGLTTMKDLIRLSVASRQGTS